MANPAESENFFDGKPHRMRAGKGWATVVGEYSYTAGINILYTREDNGNIGVFGIDPDHPDKTTIVTIYSDGGIIVMNPNTKGMVAKNKVPEYRRMVEGLVNGAFPKGAEEIVPLL